MNLETNAPLPHVVVLGAGLAGLTFGQEFPSELMERFCALEISFGVPASVRFR